MKIACLIILITFSFMTSASASEQSVGENTYRWTRGEYYINDTLVYKTQRSQKGSCWSEEKARLLGYVSNMVTLHIFGSQHCDGTARIHHWEKISTYRVINKKVESVSLLDLFSRDAILSKLMSDSYITNKYPINTRNEIRKNLSKTSEACETVSAPTLDNFAIHHHNQNEISIRLFLVNCSSRSRSIQLGFYIRPDNKILEAVKLSATKKLLMQDLE